MVEGFVFKMMNGHGMMNATQQAVVDQKMKNHFTVFKGMLCLVEALLKNVNIEIPNFGNHKL